jgi:c-di-GMP-binding flagellar brake protein YcgR
MSRDRRIGHRIPLEAMFTVVARERPLRALSADLSDAGIGLHTVAGTSPRAGEVVGVEIELPGTGDSLWARGEVCYQRSGDLASGLGVRFTAMARQHARVLRDFVVEARRSHLGALLGRIRGAAI